MSVENYACRRLEGRKAFVTGGAQGIGEAICNRFLDEGAIVAIADINADVGNATVARIQTRLHNEGRRDDLDNVVRFEQCDVTKRESVARAIGSSVEHFGGLTTLILNAGVTKDSGLAKMTEEQWDAVLNVNGKGLFNCLKEGVPHLREAGGGQIVMASSVVQDGNFGQGNYAYSKGGTTSLAKTMARELAKSGITVNAVAPGFISTDMTRQMPPEKFEAATQNCVLKRAGTVDEMAAVYAFLVSPDGSFVTGTCLEADGGYAA